MAAYFGVAAKLLDPNAEIPNEIKPLVDQEVALIQAHDTATTSPIMGVQEDYTQYVPRGHYTRNEQFQRFFLAMMWYGRAGFAISGEKATGVPLTVDEARANAWAGITLARLLDPQPAPPASANATPLALWASIYQPTSFLVGESDDLTPPQFAELSRKIFGDTLPDRVDAGSASADRSLHRRRGETTPGANPRDRAVRSAEGAPHHAALFRAALHAGQQHLSATGVR